MTVTPTIHAARRIREARAQVSGELFRKALAAHPAGVVVVTGRDQEGPVGLTATSFVAISVDPPLIAFAVDRSCATWPRLRHSANLVVHLLGEDQHDLATRFATKDLDRFGEPTRWAPLATGEPLLADAPSWLRTTLDEHIALGDHFLVVARVLEACIDGTGAPLIYHQRSYRALKGTR
jgi:flavin reductase (DIM6/NTAB) family NADH-FMN oxidoreductase RutF